jgi:hypothetical protein
MHLSNVYVQKTNYIIAKCFEKKLIKKIKEKNIAN